jgi:ERF superfamily
MPRSSDSVAALACALAKAQAALVNPEKSLTATILTDRGGQRERSFRYAPLAAGLDIVRKTLSQHEIAVIQTTATDQATGIVNLSTMLAHASGEWISSEWPVCAVADMATPRRMGAALTYARRYALFTLVGIAGEDDLDAPDLHDEPAKFADLDSAPAQSNPPHRPSKPGNGGWRKSANRPATPILDQAQSSALLDRLMHEVANIETTSAAAIWARGALAAKNTLTVADAQRLEQTFEQKLATLASLEEPEVASKPAGPDSSAKPRPKPMGIDKSVLAIATPRRHRNKAHLRHVAQQACLVCGRKPSDPHHLRFTQPRALGLKVSDEFTVPLCRGHHRAAHHSGDETAWWRQIGIDPRKAARKLWRQTRRSELPRLPGRASRATLHSDTARAIGTEDRTDPVGSTPIVDDG